MEDPTIRPLTGVEVVSLAVNLPGPQAAARQHLPLNGIRRNHGE
ncbi:hypothetical protein ACWCW7_06035 [Nocardia tengchongensis]